MKKTLPFIFLFCFLTMLSLFVQSQNFKIDKDDFLNSSNKSTAITKQANNSAEVITSESANTQIINQTNDVEKGLLYKALVNLENDRTAQSSMMFYEALDEYDNHWDTLFLRVGQQTSLLPKDSILMLFNHRDLGAFCFPHKGRLLSAYGPRGRRNHCGVDIKLNLGDTVRAAFNGIVRISRRYSSFGKIVVIRHPNGLETVYAHNSKLLVEPNQTVIAGQPIGLGGRTGRATTEHIHFETRYLGRHFNPENIIDFYNYTLKSDTFLVCNTIFNQMSKINNKARNTTVSNGMITHKITNGDTLFSIAKRYNTSVTELCQINGISKNSILKIGQKIKVKK